MYTAETIIQRNLVVLEFVSPSVFRKEVYWYIDFFSYMSIDALIETMNALSQILMDKDLSMSMESVAVLVEKNDVESLTLVAKLNALATLIALKSAPFQKSLEWWKNVSCQLVDVSMPLSDTLH